MIRFPACTKKVLLNKTFFVFVSDLPDNPLLITALGSWEYKRVKLRSHRRK